MLTTVLSYAWLILPLAAVGLVVMMSLHRIGPTEVGLVTKKFASKKLEGDNPIAFHGEAGYQAELLMPGLRWKLWPIYSVNIYPWVQVPAGEIGVMIAQVGARLPIGAKSAIYKPEFGTFTDLASFLTNGGQKGVQRPVLPPGTLIPIHPVAFIVLTKREVYGLPISDELQAAAEKGDLSIESFGLEERQFNLVRIETDQIGIITVHEGESLEAGDIASRIGGFADIEQLEANGSLNADLVGAIITSKNAIHNAYQDFQLFLDGGGKIGLQHDPLLAGSYTLNPFLVAVDIVPMLVIEQGQVAVIKSYTGLPTKDTSGTDFKFGSLVKPGHRGIWEEPLRTGKFPINPKCYQAVIVPTSILTLNWAEAVSTAHSLDRHLSQIAAKSREGFIFKIDLQVQIHVPDTKAPKVISIVGTMENLVNEVLQAAVGNHFRDKLQSMEAVKFIEQRQEVQIEAQAHIATELLRYEVETRGVYIQDVIFPEELVTVLTEREIANQKIATFVRMKEAEVERVDMERAKGTANMQNELAQSQVSVSIEEQKALARKATAEGEAAYKERMGQATGTARKAEAEGEAAYIEQTGKARGAEVRAVGLARAEGFEKQKAALGEQGVLVINAIAAFAEVASKLTIPIVPSTLIVDGNGGSGSGPLNGVLASLMQHFAAPTTALPAPPADDPSKSA